jgi:hypothetical protein
MAKLCDLPSCFMQAFLKANPNSLVDSNGYLRSEYEAELARRAEPIPVTPSSVPDPRSFQPQFQDVPFPEFEPITSDLGFELSNAGHIEATERSPQDGVLFDHDAPVAEQAAPIIAKLKVDLQAATEALVSETGWQSEQLLIVPVEQATESEVIEPAPGTTDPVALSETAVPEGIETPAGRQTTDLAEIEQEFAAQHVLGEDQKYAVEPETQEPNE